MVGVPLFHRTAAMPDTLKRLALALVASVALANAELGAT